MTRYQRTLTRTPLTCESSSPSGYSVKRLISENRCFVVRKFYNSYVTSYRLDSAYYYTLPDFTWDAMLKHIGVKFELLTDMVIFIERGIRGLS